MATNKDTSRVRSSRNSRKAALRPSADPIPIEITSAWDPIKDAIEEERGRLMTAEAVLHCVAIAMDEDDTDRAHGPDYQTLIDLARGVIKWSIDQLDSVRLKPMLEKVGTHGSYEVKDRAAEYVH